MINRLEIDEEGNKFWWKGRKLHRENGPAVERVSGTKSWFQDGKHHRLDGPAVERYNGSKTWYFHGKYIPCNSQEEFERIIKLKMFW